MTIPFNHTSSAAIAAAPFVSVLVQLPIIISSLVGIAALWYYYLVITKELRARKAEKDQLKQSGQRVADKVHEDL